MYLYEHDNWTNFTWDDAVVRPLLGDVRFAQGVLLGQLSSIGFDLSREAEMNVLCSETVASSQVEGVTLDAAKVRSSVAKRLGVEIPGAPADTHDVDGAVDVTLDAVRNYEEPLTEERLFAWHAALFPTGYSGLRKIDVARYRSTAMMVVSGPIGHERVHYEAPPASDVPALMRELVNWVEAEDAEEPVMKAAVAHLWFLTIHPFDDGNGRIARALTEMLLSRADASSRRFYSMAGHILDNRDGYYSSLERAQHAGPDITEWLVWFLDAVGQSVEDSAQELQAVVKRSAFWQSLEATPLNRRQRKVLVRLLGGFEGKLTAAKWAKLCKVSADTALRDINDLIAKGILIRSASRGRSTSYELAELE